MGGPLELKDYGRSVGLNYGFSVETPQAEDAKQANGVHGAGTEAVPADEGRADSSKSPAQVNDVLGRLMHFASRSFYKAITREQIGQACRQLLKSERAVPNLLEESVRQPAVIDKKLKQAITSLANAAQDAADAATKAFGKVAGLKGRELAAAYALDKRNKLVPDTQKVRKHFDAAIDKFADLSLAMAELEETLLANGLRESEAFEAIAALHQMADEHLSELQTLLVEMTALAEAGIDANDPRKDVLDRKISDLLMGMSGTMHGNFAALKKEYESALKENAEAVKVWTEFADRANDFLAKGNVSLNEVREFLASTNKFETVLSQIKAPVGSVLDKFLGRLREIRGGIEDLFRDCRLKATAHRAATPPPCRPIVKALEELSDSELDGFESVSPELVGIVRDCKACRRLLGEVATGGLTDQLDEKLSSAVKTMMGGEGLLRSRRIADVEETVKRELDDLAKAKPRFAQDLWMKLGQKGTVNVETLTAYVIVNLKEEAQRLDRQYSSLTAIKGFEDFDAEVGGSTSFSRGNVRAFLFGDLDRTLGETLETRMNGATESMMNPTFRTEDITGEEKLGSGEANTVYKLTDKSGKVWVFKPEAPAQEGLHTLNLGKLKAYEKLQQAVKLNVATRRLAEALGVENLVPEAHAVTYKGQYGLIMEMAGGCTAADYNSKNRQRQIGQSAENDPALFNQHMDSLVENLTELEYLDLIAGQGDRHWGNYMTQFQHDGTAVVKGIDNDMSFPAYRTGLTTFTLGEREYGCVLGNMAKYYPKASPQEREKLAKQYFKKHDGKYQVEVTRSLPVGLTMSLHGFYAFHSMCRPPCISQRLYEKISALDEEKIEDLRRQLLECMPEANVAATVNRIREVKKYVEYEKQSSADFVVRRTEGNPRPWVTGKTGRFLTTLGSDGELSDEKKIRLLRDENNAPLAGDFTLQCDASDASKYKLLFQNFLPRDFEQCCALLTKTRSSAGKR